MSGLKQTRLPGQATADYEAKQKKLKIATDSQRHKRLWDRLQPSFRGLENHTLTLDSQDWEDTVKDLAKQTEFYEEQLRRGKDELTIKKDQFSVTDEDAREFLKGANELDQVCERWRIKEEERLEAGALQLKQALTDHPHIAASLVNDPDIRKAVKDGLAEVETASKEIMNTLVEMEDRLYERAKEDVEAMGLAQKFEKHVQGIQHLLDGTDAARLEAEEARRGVEETLKQHIDDSSREYTELEHEKARREDELKEAQRELSQLKDQRASLNTELGTQRTEIAGLKQELDDAVKRCQTCESNAAKLQSERDGFQAECQEAMNARSRVQTELDGERSKLQELTKLTTANSELEKSKSDLQELTTKHQELTTKAQGLEEDLTKSNSKVQDLNSKLQESNDKQKSSDDLENHYKGLHERAIADHQEALEKRDEEHAAELKQKQKEFGHAVTEANEYTNRLRKQQYEEMITRDKKHAADLNKKLDQKKKDAEEQVNELRSRHQRALVSLAEEHATTLSKLGEEHDEEKAELREKHAAELKSRTGQSEDEYSALQVKNTQLLTQVKDLGNTKARLEKERVKLQTLVEQNPTELTAEISALERQVRVLRHEKSESEQQVEMTRKESETKLTAAKDQVSALEREVEASRREKSESQQQLEMTRRLLGHFN